MYDNAPAFPPTIHLRPRREPGWRIALAVSVIAVVCLTPIVAFLVVMWPVFDPWCDGRQEAEIQVMEARLATHPSLIDQRSIGGTTGCDSGDAPSVDFTPAARTSTADLVTALTAAGWSLVSDDYPGWGQHGEAVTVLRLPVDEGALLLAIGAKEASPDVPVWGTVQSDG
jgi:hypothetical protein